MKKPTRRQFIKAITATASLSSIPILNLNKSASTTKKSEDIKKIEDVVIYKDPNFYCIGPSILRRPDDELIVSFRRAPERKAFGEKETTHIDPKSQLVMLRSTNGGMTWAKPELIHAHPLGGSQEGNLIQLNDGTIVLTSYAWLQLRREQLNTMPPNFSTKHNNQYNFLGGYTLHSDNGGYTWKGPFKPPSMHHPDAVDAFGNHLPMFNRGAMCEHSNGKLYWAARSCSDVMASRHYELHLLSSVDNGETWQYECEIAKEKNISFTETSLIETQKGDLVGFVRARRLNNHDNETENALQGVPLSDHISVLIRSTDGGKSFTWKDAGFFGYPHHTLRLPDGRVWLTYGYRKKPFGIRARLLNPECTNISESKEIVLRDDGGTSDIGYPWSALLPNGQILTVYWMNIDNGLRHIAGTIVELDS